MAVALALWALTLACGGPAKDATPAAGKERKLVVTDSPAPNVEVQRRIFTFAVGVSKHEKPALSLDYAARDAEAIDSFYASAAGGSVPAARRRLLRNEEATRRGVLRALQDVASQTQEFDLLVVFMALHGVTDSADRLYFLAHDSDPNDLVATGLPESEIDYVLQGARVKRILVLVDACHAGTMGASGVAKKRELAASDTNRLIERLGKTREGVALLAASRAAETSREDKQWGGGHGVFTHHLLAGLGGAADSDGDGVVSISELADYVQRAVPEDTKNEQHPQITGRFDNRMPVALTKPRGPSPSRSVTALTCPPGATWDGKECVGAVKCYEQFHFEPGRGCVPDQSLLDALAGTTGAGVAGVADLRLPASAPSSATAARTKAIPEGDFVMGSNDGDPNEKPPHRVHVNSFEMDVTEVTAAAYSTCVGAKVCSASAVTTVDFQGMAPQLRGSLSALCNYGRADRADHPMNCVTWDEARDYCVWARKRLPTEEEWEFAARGITARRFPWGVDDPATRICWQRASLGTCKVGEYNTLGETPLGLQDMAGNVWEWTASGYSLDYSGARTDLVRVLRGGSFVHTDATFVRAAVRYRMRPSDRAPDVGFRCAR